METDEQKRKLCFVVGPIGAEDSEDRIHADWVLDGIIAPVMAGFPEFEIQRADKISVPGHIDAQIIGALLNAELVIADLSRLNPNAFYEIGIRHMTDKPIIHMQLVEEKIPFDLSLFRSVKFSRARHRDLVAAQSDLKQQVIAVLDPRYRLENPVTKARGNIEFREHADPADQVVLNELDAIKARLSELENSEDVVSGTVIPSLRTRRLLEVRVEHDGTVDRDELQLAVMRGDRGFLVDALEVTPNLWSVFVSVSSDADRNSVVAQIGRLKGASRVRSSWA